MSCVCDYMLSKGGEREFMFTGVCTYRITHIRIKQILINSKDFKLGLVAATALKPIFRNHA